MVCHIKYDFEIKLLVDLEYTETGVFPKGIRISLYLLKHLRPLRNHYFLARK